MKLKNNHKGICYICGDISDKTCESCKGEICYECEHINSFGDETCKGCYRNLMDMSNSFKYINYSMSEIFILCKPIMIKKVKKINEILKLMNNDKS